MGSKKSNKLIKGFLADPRPIPQHDEDSFEDQTVSTLHWLGVNLIFSF
jgi:hypothetical protein